MHRPSPSSDRSTGSSIPMRTSGCVRRSGKRPGRVAGKSSRVSRTAACASSAGGWRRFTTPNARARSRGRSSTAICVTSGPRRTSRKPGGRPSPRRGPRSTNCAPKGARHPMCSMPLPSSWRRGARADADRQTPHVPWAGHRAGRGDRFPCADVPSHFANSSGFRRFRVGGALILSRQVFGRPSRCNWPRPGHFWDSRRDSIHLGWRHVHLRNPDAPQLWRTPPLRPVGGKTTI